MTIISDPGWEDLITELLKLRGTAVIIGATDSGKSTMAHYLIRKLVSESLKVCLVDSDVGQSSIGLPGTIGLKVFSENTGLTDFTCEKMSFVGTINPAKKIPFIISTTKRMADTCKKSSDITLIDTSGLVTGETGRALKVGKIIAIKPEHVIAIQRRDELEHILELVEDLKIHRHKTSQYAKIRNIATRTHYRKKKFDDYFADAGTAGSLLYANEVKFVYNSRPFTPQEGMFKKGTLIGLNHDDDTTALGILDDITDKSVTFLSPVKSLKKINRVVFGDITV